MIYSSDRQWFSFEATATTQYIHAQFTGTEMTSMYVQVYNSGGTAVGNQITLSNSNPSASPTLTQGETYYIKTQFYSGNGGRYKIGFNTSIVSPPGAIQLTANQWEDSYLPYGQQWFSFEATATTQYIHVELGALSSMSVQVYDSDGVAVGSETGINVSSTKYISRSPLTVAQTYYIRVRLSSNSGGDYRIAFNTSTTAPASP